MGIILERDKFSLPLPDLAIGFPRPKEPQRDWTKEALRLILKEGDFDSDLEITACQRAALEFPGSYEEKVEEVAGVLTADLEHLFLEYGRQSLFEIWDYEKKEINGQVRLIAPGHRQGFEASLKRTANNTQDNRDRATEIGWEKIEKEMAKADEGRVMAWASPTLPGLDYSYLYFYVSKANKVEAAYLRNDFSPAAYRQILKGIDRDLVLKEGSVTELVENPVVFPREVTSFSAALASVKKILKDRPFAIPGKQEIDIARLNLEGRMAYYFRKVCQFSQAIVEGRNHEVLKKLLMEVADEIYSFLMQDRKVDEEKLEKAISGGDTKEVFALMGITMMGSCPSASSGEIGTISSESLTAEARSLIEQGICPLCGQRLANGYCHWCQLKFKG